MLSNVELTDKNNERKELFTNICNNSNILVNQEEKDYFLDLVNDISLTKDLARGEVNLATLYVYNSYTLNRMYRVGTILNRPCQTDEEMSFVREYIDSCCVEFAKVGYDIGLIRFRKSVNSLVSKVYGEDTSMYDAIIHASNDLDNLITNKKKPKTKKIKKSV